MRTGFALGVVAVLLGGLLTTAPVSTATAAPMSERATAQQTYQRTAFRATNNRRENHGLRRLKRNDCVQKYAVRNARRMARRGEMEHQKLEPIMRDCGLNYAGENIAYGYPTGRAVVRGWMHSPGHRANILRPQFRLMGLAARKGSKDK